MNKEFFANKEIVVLLDRMAKRYGKLPHEILNDLTIEEYNFDLAVMLGSELYIKAEKEKPKETNWSEFGISRTVIKKEHK